MLLRMGFYKRGATQKWHFNLKRTGPGTATTLGLSTGKHQGLGLWWQVNVSSSGISLMSYLETLELLEVPYHP